MTWPLRKTECRRILNRPRQGGTRTSHTPGPSVARRQAPSRVTGVAPYVDPGAVGPLSVVCHRCRTLRGSWHAAALGPLPRSCVTGAAPYDTLQCHRPFAPVLCHRCRTLRGSRHVAAPSAICPGPVSPVPHLTRILARCGAIGPLSVLCSATPAQTEVVPDRSTTNGQRSQELGAHSQTSALPSHPVPAPARGHAHVTQIVVPWPGAMQSVSMQSVSPVPPLGWIMTRCGAYGPLLRLCVTGSVPLGHASGLHPVCRNGQGCRPARDSPMEPLPRPTKQIMVLPHALIPAGTAA